MYSPRFMANGGIRVDRPIVLVGLMGAGKTTVGRTLAKRLQLDFIDVDEEIERAAGLTVTEIFERYGETHFRKQENRVIAELLEGPPKVIATGGGAFADEATRALILQRCFAVWLRADIETLVERVARQKDRPLLKGRDAWEALTALSRERAPDYAQAHLKVESDGLTPEQTADRIIEALAELAR
jgi:shikimate kinase